MLIVTRPLREHFACYLVEAYQTAGRCNNRLPIGRLQRVCSTICMTVTREATMLTVSTKDTFVPSINIRRRIGLSRSITQKMDAIIYNKMISIE